ncbi:hypothetical protein KIN20_002793 [Parelaphostrongylus tenuis]|uniref:Uncharacterized protein n=1 Tax=Parelaphostrongylus tenuis TaxID=148309 RepID=A0AAD5MP16_PARTN|nr:hypothetical protein KIN20_002793 [Parelaphostrongylus tenuis]
MTSYPSEVGVVSEGGVVAPTKQKTLPQLSAYFVLAEYTKDNYTSSSKETCHAGTAFLSQGSNFRLENWILNGT